MSRAGALFAFAAILAAPPAATGEHGDAVERVLTLVNEARASARRCGWKRFDAAPPLVRSAALDRAAQAHAQDMAARSRMEHAGGDGSTPGERATRAGYAWSRIGENVAVGQPTPELAVESWIESPRHCANLMDPGYTQMGVGFADDPRSATGYYWAQVFGTPPP